LSIDGGRAFLWRWWRHDAVRPGAGAPRWTDAVLLVARLITGVVMLYYGWPKIRNPRKNAKDFDATGFRPGWLFGTLVGATSSSAFGFEMLMGTIVKATKWHKPFTDYSYDLLLLALCLLVLALGPGAYRV
jgi:uncharacterized membrane protein YphA (DoxX/SURF4 family)